MKILFSHWFLKYFHFGPSLGETINEVFGPSKLEKWPMRKAQPVFFSSSRCITKSFVDEETWEAQLVELV